MNPMVTAPVEKQGRCLRRLSREAWAALLRVRIWPEWPELNLSKLTWASKPDCGIATPQKRQKVLT